MNDIGLARVDYDYSTRESYARRRKRVENSRFSTNMSFYREYVRSSALHCVL